MAISSAGLAYTAEKMEPLVISVLLMLFAFVISFVLLTSAVSHVIGRWRAKDNRVAADVVSHNVVVLVYDVSRQHPRPNGHTHSLRSVIDPLARSSSPLSLACEL